MPDSFSVRDLAEVFKRGKMNYLSICRHRRIKISMINLREGGLNGCLVFWTSLKLSSTSVSESSTFKEQHGLPYARPLNSLPVCAVHRSPMLNTAM